MDVGPKTIGLFREEIARAGTVVWNGPVGKFKDEPFSKGTRAVAEAWRRRRRYDCWRRRDGRGGRGIRPVADKMTHVSTGGGAFMEYVEGTPFVALHGCRIALETAWLGWCPEPGLQARGVADKARRLHGVLPRVRERAWAVFPFSPATCTPQDCRRVRSNRLDESPLRRAVEALLQDLQRAFGVPGEQAGNVNPQSGKNEGARNAPPVGRDGAGGGEMEPEELLVLNGQDEVFQHPRLLVVGPLLIQVNGQRTVSHFGEELRRSGHVAFGIHGGAAAVFRRDPECEVRPRFVLLAQDDRGVVSNSVLGVARR